MIHSKAAQRAMISLDGLSVGDALGETFFEAVDSAGQRIRGRTLPPAPWRYTDDTEMAVSIVEALIATGTIDPGDLTQRFARRYDPLRGYGLGAHRLLTAYRRGADWHTEPQLLFSGRGSFGNGAAMRVAPLGAFYATDFDRTHHFAEQSALPTHVHPEGIAGAVAVAIAAAFAWRVGEGERGSPADLLDAVLDYVPPGETKRGIERARAIPFTVDPTVAAARLGSGDQISAPDTVPFTLWCAARHLDDYEEAFWATVSGLGDRDTTCAIVGGIPHRWLACREPLPRLGAPSPGAQA